MKTGIIDVGGGFRDIYGAGVRDYCLDRGIGFDYALGVSAGTANLASFLAGQRGRNYKFYMEYGFRKEYASLENFLKHRSYVDLDYAYGTLSNEDGECPFDFDAFFANPTPFMAVACDADTGEPIYYDKSRVRKNDLDPLKASSALPVFCKPYVVDGVPGLDGGIVDPIPLGRAFADGCERVVLILTRPVAEPRVQKKDVMPARLLARRYPRAAERILSRWQVYNDGVALAQRYASEGRVLIVAPDDVCGLSTLARSHEKLEQMYAKGYRDAEAIEAFMKA